MQTPSRIEEETVSPQASAGSWHPTQEEMILPFSENQEDEEKETSVVFYSNDILEQNQIVYISMLKQKHHKLVETATHMYSQVEKDKINVPDIVAALQ